MNGRGSLAGLMPYSNANDVVVSMASDVLPVVKHTPVIAGVQNFPTVGLIDGNFRMNLEETGMGYGTEVEMVRLAHEMDLVTTPYVFNPEEAKLMAEAGADVIVAHSEYPKTDVFEVSGSVC
jgi:predicted TIM-barrel enzyme